MDLAAIRAFLFDLDGCVFAGNTLLPGVRDVIGRLREDGRRVFFLTNNSRQSSAELHAKLGRLGLAAGAAEILSGAEAAGPFLAEQFGPSLVLMAGSATLGRLLVEHGHRLAPWEAFAEAGVVLVGHDEDIDFGRLAALSRAAARRAAFVAVNRDPRVPLEGGDFLPGCGAVVAAVAAASGVEPMVIGKPAPYLFRLALARLGVLAAQAAMVGDDPLADIGGAARVGLRTIWLSPGEAPAGAQVPADLTIRSFDDLARRL
jgi:HAD superfamily hydrolase (TIGR01450 family)